MKTKLLLIASLICLVGGILPARADYITTVESTPNLLGYWRFTPASQANSEVNGYTGTFMGHAAVGSSISGPGISGDSSNSAVLLDASANTFVNTNLTGQIGTQGSIVGWFYLTALPSFVGHHLMIADASDAGGHMGLQIETDNKIKFYTDTGSATVAPTALTNADLFKWHFIAATFTSNTSRRIYLDGSLAASSVPGARTLSNGTFAIGESNVFGGRFFKGRLDEIALFNRELTATEISNIYANAAPVTPPAPVCVTPPSGLVSWWPGENNARDIRSGNNGTLVDNVTFAPGQVGQAFNFDGTSIAYVNVPNSPSLNLTGNQVTLEGWVYPRTTPPASVIYFGKTLSGFNDYLLGVRNGQFAGVIRTPAGEAFLDTFITLPANVWSHIALTYDGATMKIYLNGDVVASGALTGNIGGANVPFDIGGRSDIASIDGLIDEVAVFSRALAPSEIFSLYTAGSAGKCNGASTTQTISGRVATASGAGLVNVTVQLSGSATRQVFTDSTGFYAFRSLARGGNYTITPLQTPNLSINPANRTFNNLTTDQTANFTGTSNTFTISGKIADPDGIGVNGITISLSGAASQDTITDSSGRYTFGNLVTGSYTVTPATNPNFNFNPSNKVFGNVISNQTADFAATSTVPVTRIAFERFGIFVMDADGKHQTRLTKSVFDTNPALSPDGTKIVFKSLRDGDNEIYVMNADGSNQTRLTNSPGFDGYPAWSPDGAKIAFVSARDGNLQIYVMNADGSNQTRLTNNTVSDYEPAWSPNGGLIAFATTRDFDWEIYIMNPDGSGQTRLTNSPGIDGYPAWSPDGSKIAFVSKREGNLKIYVMSSDGSNPTRLTNTNSPAYDDGPAWLPDGSKIAFFSSRDQTRDQNREIYVMNADGSDQTRLTTSPYSQYPSCGPQATVATPVSSNVATQSGNLTVTPASANVTVQLGNVTVTYASVNTAGKTTINPIAPTSVLPLPAGYATITGTGLAYNITTTATVTPPITACFKVPSINDQAVFNSLRILHGENGTLVDRTILPPNTPAPSFATRTICANVNSLSPFVIVQAIDPSLPVIDGLVVDGNGQPLSDIDVTLSGDRTLTTQTDINGRFLFVNLIPGGNYTVTPSAGNFAFNPQNTSFQNIQNDQAKLFVGSAVAPPPPGIVSLAISKVSVSEGAGSVEIPVINSGGSPGEVTVDYATSDTAGSQNCNVFNGRASSRCDYITTIGTLTFAPGETIKSIFIPIVDDLYAEGPETFTITLSNPRGTSLGSPATATVTIIDNDSVNGPPTLLVDETSGRAAALDSVTSMRDPFSIINRLNFSSDQRTRVTLFAISVDLMPGEDNSVITAQAEDAQHHVYPLTVEAVAKVPKMDWLTEIVVKLPDTLANAGDVQVGISLRGVNSNKVVVRIE